MEGMNTSGEKFVATKLYEVSLIDHTFRPVKLCYHWLIEHEAMWIWECSG